MTAAEGAAVDQFIAALREDDAELLYERAPCGYVTTTADGLIIKANETFLTLGGYEREALVGRLRFDELLPPGARIYHETHFAPMLRMQGTAREIAFDLVRSDGARVPVLVNAVLERDDEGRPGLIRSAVFDATHRREYERELLRAKQAADREAERASALARTLQQTLIPPAPPLIAGLDLAAVFRAGGAGAEVGGDFYDVFQLGADEWAFVLGDVCGKGAQAAVVTALARFSVRGAAMQVAGAAGTLRQVNGVLGGYSESTRFCSMLCLRLRRAADRSWHGPLASAGHSLPFVRRRDGSVQTIGRIGTLLGVIDDPPLHDVDVVLAPGDLLLLYTDGVSEARRGDDFYGDERIRSLLEDDVVDAASFARALLADVTMFASGAPQDDIAVLAVRVPDR